MDGINDAAANTVHKLLAHVETQYLVPKILPYRVRERYS
jgi:hypothetical protein